MIYWWEHLRAADVEVLLVQHAVDVEGKPRNPTFVVLGRGWKIGIKLFVVLNWEKVFMRYAGFVEVPNELSADQSRDFIRLVDDKPPKISPTILC